MLADAITPDVLPLLKLNSKPFVPFQTLATERTSRDLLGLFVQCQTNITIIPILASKLDVLDYDLSLYMIHNNNKVFQRVYEIIF